MKDKSQFKNSVVSFEFECSRKEKLFQDYSKYIQRIKISSAPKTIYVQLYKMQHKWRKLYIYEIKKQNKTYMAEYLRQVIRRNNTLQTGIPVAT